MNHRILDWDSQFFGATVHRLDVDSSTDPGALAHALASSGADVTYVFVPADLAARFGPVLDGMANGRCVDRKVTYERAAAPRPPQADDAVVEATVESEALLQLAYASGHLSRFFLDPRFQPRFRAMYAEWLRKALREPSSRVFCFAPEGAILAMVTASVAGDEGRVGLIAVDAQCRGQGVGARLLAKCEEFYATRGATTWAVVTQKDNLAACSLYEKCGYHVADEQCVWHVWRA